MVRRRVIGVLSGHENVYLSVKTVLVQSEIRKSIFEDQDLINRVKIRKSRFQDQVFLI